LCSVPPLSIHHLRRCCICKISFLPAFPLLISFFFREAPRFGPVWYQERLMIQPVTYSPQDPPLPLFSIGRSLSAPIRIDRFVPPLLPRNRFSRGDPAKGFVRFRPLPEKSLFCTPRPFFASFPFFFLLEISFLQSEPGDFLRFETRSPPPAHRLLARFFSFSWSFVVRMISDWSFRCCAASPLKSEWFCEGSPVTFFRLPPPRFVGTSFFFFFFLAALRQHGLPFPRITFVSFPYPNGGRFFRWVLVQSGPPPEPPFGFFEQPRSAVSLDQGVLV